MGNQETEMTDMQQVHDEMVAEAPPEAPRKSSGYRRLQVRHRNLLAEHEVLRADLSERDQIESELQASIDRLLEQHKRIMQTVKGAVRYSRRQVGTKARMQSSVSLRTILIGLPCKR
jgi:hypothetical protein